MISMAGASTQKGNQAPAVMRKRVCPRAIRLSLKSTEQGKNGGFHRLKTTVSPFATGDLSIVIVQYGHERMKGASCHLFAMNLPPFMCSCPSETQR
jgi:hypothetical protein